MTENDSKLRDLLAEAQQVLTRVQAILCHPGPHACDQWGCALQRRIDAALAEPVEPCADCEIEIKLAHQERDEARAEVRRLRVLLGETVK